MTGAAAQRQAIAAPADQLEVVARLMGLGHTCEAALAMVTGGMPTRAARLGAIVAETCGHPVEDYDGLWWVRALDPAISQVLDAGCLAWRCWSCRGEGEIPDRVYGTAQCGACGGDGVRRVPEAADWRGEEEQRVARTGGYILTVKLAWPQAADRFVAGWSVLDSVGSGIGTDTEISVRLHHGESREEGKSRALLAGMIAAEDALGQGVR